MVVVVAAVSVYDCLFVFDCFSLLIDGCYFVFWLFVAIHNREQSDRRPQTGQQTNGFLSFLSLFCQVLFLLVIFACCLLFVVVILLFFACCLLLVVFCLLFAGCLLFLLLVVCKAYNRNGDALLVFLLFDVFSCMFLWKRAPNDDNDNQEQEEEQRQQQETAFVCCLFVCCLLVVCCLFIVCCLIVVYWLFAVSWLFV